MICSSPGIFLLCAQKFAAHFHHRAQLGVLLGQSDECIRFRRRGELRLHLVETFDDFVDFFTRQHKNSVQTGRLRHFGSNGERQGMAGGPADRRRTGVRAQLPALLS